MTISTAVIEFLLPARGSERRREANTQIGFEKTQKTDKPNSYMPEQLLFSLLGMVLKHDFRSKG
jgi:hypothetical protein